jgi:hypothetical protein
MLVAARAEFVARFAAAWPQMGFTGPILVPEECRGLPSGLPGVQTAPFADLLKRTQMFIFEFGVATQRNDERVRDGRKCGKLDVERLKVVEKLFTSAASAEARTRPAGHRLPRRFIGVNVIYNKFWPLFTDYIAANINPFCSQVLAGAPRNDVPMRRKIEHLRARYPR